MHIYYIPMAYIWRALDPIFLCYFFPCSCEYEYVNLFCFFFKADGEWGYVWSWWVEKEYRLRIKDSLSNKLKDDLISVEWDVGITGGLSRLFDELYMVLECSTLTKLKMKEEKRKVPRLSCRFLSTYAWMWGQVHPQPKLQGQKFLLNINQIRL